MQALQQLRDRKEIRPPAPLPETQASSRRPRDYLTPREVDMLIAVARQLEPHGEHDAALILILSRHGLSVSELIALKWSQIDLEEGWLQIVRQKSTPFIRPHSTHPLWLSELRALRSLKCTLSDTDYVFVPEQNVPLTADDVSW